MLESLPETQLPASVRRLLSLLIVAQFATVLLALLSNLAPSAVQGTLLQWCAPWQVSTGQDYILQPLEWTHGQNIDTALVPQVRFSDEDSWKLVPLAGGLSRPSDDDFVAGDEARPELPEAWNNMSRLARWIAESQPTAEVLSEISAAFARYAERTSGREVAEVRFFAPYTFSFDEDMVVAAGQAELLDDSVSGAFAGSVVFGGEVVRTGENEIAIAAYQDSAQTSKPFTGASEGGQ